MDTFAQTLLAIMHNGSLYNEATELLNNSIGEDGFCIWIDLPDGNQFVLPVGSKIKTLNYAPIVKG